MAPGSLLRYHQPWASLPPPGLEISHWVGREDARRWDRSSCSSSNSPPPNLLGHQDPASLSFHLGHQLSVLLVSWKFPLGAQDAPSRAWVPST